MNERKHKWGLYIIYFNCLDFHFVSTAGPVSLILLYAMWKPSTCEFRWGKWLSNQTIMKLFVSVNLIELNKEVLELGKVPHILYNRSCRRRTESLHYQCQEMTTMHDSGIIKRNGNTCRAFRILFIWYTFLAINLIYHALHLFHGENLNYSAFKYISR